jgi:hypothetical protein
LPPVFPASQFRLYGSRQRWARSIPAEPAEFVFQVLFGLIGDIPDLLFGLEIGDELSGDGHLPTIGDGLLMPVGQRRAVTSRKPFGVDIC